MTTQEMVINYTNSRLKNWYDTVKREYNVIGEGTTSIVDNEIFIKYTEDGVERVWKMAFYKEYVQDNGLSYFFDVWGEVRN
jgi:hypothetical protein